MPIPTEHEGCPEHDPEYWLIGCDAGVSFLSTLVPAQEKIVTIISNSTEGVWPVAKIEIQQFVDAVWYNPDTALKRGSFV